MIDLKLKHDTIRTIQSLQLSANLIIDLEDAIKANDVIMVIDSLQGLANQWN